MFSRLTATGGKPVSRLIASALCVLLVSTAGCRHSADRAAETAALKTRLAAAAPPAFVGTAADDQQLWAQTRSFYEHRDSAPAWIVAGKPEREVRTLDALLNAAADEGLNPLEYGVDGIALKLQALKASRNDAASATAAQDLELSLSFELMRYARNLALGHPIARQIDPDWNVTPRPIDLAAVVAKAVADKDLEDLPKQLAPPHPEYARLRDMLQRYRKLAAEHPLQTIPADFKLTEGPASPALKALRDNLLILGDLQEKPRGDDNVFDEDLSKAQGEFQKRNAVQPAKTPDAAKVALVDTVDKNLAAAISRFEARHGLNPDGVPDPAMIAAMNVPMAERVRQLELNLERWRWMPADFGSPYIFVNIAGYSLQVRDQAEAVPLKMRVIVGDGTHRTPIFSDTMTEIVFSPYWNIPQSIQAKEMLPAIAKDSNYLKKKDIEVVRIVNGQTQVVDSAKVDWDKDGDSYQLRQKSGDKNSLGLVKFLFPNHYNVYLHDTPADNLFDKLTRDLSHGCVRLEQPVELATYLLRGQSEWTPASIDAAMNAGKEDHVTLKNPTPVHLVYLTARVDEDGVPQFFGDAYGYDARQQALTK